ncbi:hypothetical protein DTO10_07740 [Peribacillus butanolivorans]|uniref:Uncharacterized protein n=1 Tax=Peribacillus butanolivorans TaxID=421767 RepID=A0ABN5MYQ1_9BACI|nr:hypothetical protein DTO10_07740 [Peribacillus butanolivorans]
MLAIMVAMFTPPFLDSSFQKYFATGIYAISYERDISSCSFEMNNEKTLHGECELPFENYSRDDAQFTIEFFDEHEDDGFFMLMLEAKLIEKSELHKLSLLDPLDGLRQLQNPLFLPKTL